VHTSRPESTGNTQSTRNAYHQLINREGKHKRRRRRRRAKGSRFGKGTSGGSGSTGREAIEEKERKMKRWRGIESICFLLNKRRNKDILFGFCEKNTANPISVKKA